MQKISQAAPPSLPLLAAFLLLSTAGCGDDGGGGGMGPGGPWGGARYDQL